MNFNQVIIAGRLTRDVEMRYLTKGTAVAQIGLAVNRHWKSEAGENKEETTFVDCEAFGRQAETLAQYLKKGSGIHIVGRLKTDSWDDKASGQKRSKLKVVIESFQFVGGSQEQPAQRPVNAPRELAQPIHQQDGDTKRPMAEIDDVPF